MRKNKILSLLLVTAITASIFTGCGNQDVQNVNSKTQNEKNSEATSGTTDKEENKASEEITDGRLTSETVTFTIAGEHGASATTDWNSTIQFQEYEKRLGIKLDGTTYDTETWKTQLTLMLAEDELPDIIGASQLSPTDLYKYGKDGYFLDFSQYLDQMPNLSAFLEAYPEYKRAITMENGAIYGFSTFNMNCDSSRSHAGYLATKWLENLDMEVPETLEQFYEMLVAFKEQDANGNGDPNDEIPMLYYPNPRTGNENPILWAFGIYPAHGGAVVPWIQADENGKVQLMDATENAKEYYKFMNKLYEEDLINHDCYSGDAGQLQEIAFSGRVGYLGGWQPTDYENQIANEWRTLPGLTSEYNDEQVLVVRGRVGSTFRLMVNANVENVDVMIKFIDYLFTEEGIISAVNGYEGVTFDYVDLAGFDSIDHTNYAAKYDTNEQYRRQEAVALNALQIVSVNKGFWYMIENIDEDKLLSKEILEVATINAVQEVAFRGDTKVMTSFPVLKYSEEDGKERTTIRTDLLNYITTMSAQFITGELDIDANWDNYLAQLKLIGMDRLLEIEQVAYDNYMAVK